MTLISDLSLLRSDFVCRAPNTVSTPEQRANAVFLLRLFAEGHAGNKYKHKNL
jgi:hypothetical protein